jgi:ribosomal protein S18 acetylase RimI-like enzyme
MQDLRFATRTATPADARLLATLVDLAGEGIPAFLWGQQAVPGQTPLDIGMQRAARAEGGFSYKKAWIAEVGGRAAGMLLGYPQPDPYETGPLDDLPPVVRPLVELEALSPGSWYVNAVAVLPDHRGAGVGSRLMALAKTSAGSAGCRDLSLIVAEDNRGAVALYRRLGYAEAARRQVVTYPGCRHGGDWLLMVCPVAAG